MSAAPAIDLTAAPSRVPMAPARGAPRVNVGGAVDRLARSLIERADGARRRADDQGIVRKRLALGYQRAGADQTVLTDARAVEHDRAHADQRIGADGAAE